MSLLFLRRLLIPAWCLRTLSVLLFSCVFALAAAQADIVHLATGGTLEGEVTRQGHRVTVKTKYGSVTLRQDEVLRVEHVATPQEVYRERAKGLTPGDVNGHYQLAQWCREQGLTEQAETEARAVLSADPNHEGAHRILGHVLFRGRWVERAERESELARSVLPKLGAVLDACRAALAGAGAPSLAGRVGEVDALKAELTPRVAANVGAFAESLPGGPMSVAEADRLLTSLQDVLGLARRVSLSGLRDASHLGRARGLIAEYFLATSASAEAEAVTALKALGDVSAEVVGVLAQEGTFYQAMPAGEQVRPLSVGADRTEYAVLIPPDYDPKRAYPLLVALHGKGGTGPKFLARWKRTCLEHGYILACPTSPYGKGGYGARPQERALVVATVEDVSRVYHVDPDRVFLAGTSAGGHATWDAGLLHPDRFAGIIPEAGIPVHEGLPMTRYLYLRNTLGGLAVHALVGENDRVVREVCEEANRRLKALGADASLVVVPGVGHGYYPSEDENVFAWMAERRRNPAPTSVFKQFHHLSQGWAYWLQVTALAAPEWDSSKPLRLPGSYDADISKARLLELARAQLAHDLPSVRGSVEGGNVVKVAATGVKALTIYLSPRLIDFSRPVRIEANGTWVWNRPVSADVGVVLGEMKHSWDLGELYLAAIDCDLGSKTARAWTKATGGQGRTGP